MKILTIYINYTKLNYSKNKYTRIKKIKLFNLFPLTYLFIVN